MELSNEPAKYAAAITPSDTALLANPTRGIYVGTTGDLRVKMRGTNAGGGIVTFYNIPVGLYSLAVIQVLSTGTDAEQIVGVW
jgi:hypothetical protein